MGHNQERKGRNKLKKKLKRKQFEKYGNKQVEPS